MAIMENIKCSIQPCCSVPKLVCDCQSKPVYLCLQHQQSHMETGFRTKHNLHPLFARLSDKEINTLINARNKILESRKSMIFKINEKLREKIDKLTKKYKGYLFSALESLNSLLRELDNAISSNSALRTSPDQFLYQLSSIPKLENSKKNYTLENILYTKMDFYFPHFEQQRYNYSFDHNSKSLVQIDNASLHQRHKRSYINIDDLTESLGDFAGTCILENGNVFYCGGVTAGHYNSYANAIDKVYVINPRKRKMKKIANLIVANYKIVPSVLDRCVYLFGGIDNLGQSSVRAFAYCLTSKCWKTLRDMPTRSFCTSCVSAGNSILIYGNGTSGVYEFKNNEYSKVLDTPSGFGFICKNSSGKIFVLANGTIFESYEKNYKKRWEKKGSYNKHLISESLETAPQLFGDSFYFKVHPNQYLRFNFESLTVDSPGISDT